MGGGCDTGRRPAERSLFCGIDPEGKENVPPPTWAYTLEGREGGRWKIDGGKLTE